MTTLPTAAQARTVSTVSALEAQLLAGFAASTLAGWPPGAPQRDLVTAEAGALQWEQVQRLCIAYAASPQRILQLAAVLQAQGYSATDAASVASAWTDVVLEIYQTPRIAATLASWQIPLQSAGPFTVDNTSTITLQAADGTIFQAAQLSPLQANSGNGYTIAPTFAARNPGTSGNVIPGTINRIMSAPVGIQITGTGQALLVAARNAESDVDALTRAQARWGTLSGVLTASGWQYVLLTGVPTLTRVFVDDTNPGGPGSLGIAIANGAGPALPSEVAAALAIVAARTIAGTGPVALAAATQLVVPLAVMLRVIGNPLAAAQCASALAQLGPALAGNVLYLDDLRVVCKGIAGVVGDVGLSLTADVARPPGGVIVLSPTVTAS